MSEFDDGPTPDQVHELFRETTVLLTMLAHPRLHGAADRGHQAERTYALSPPHALVVLASIGAGRFWRMSLDQDASEGALERQPFPRGVLQTVPSDGRPDLLFHAIDLVETVARSGHARPLVDQLLIDGVRAYRVLLSVVHELGWLAARADRTVRNVVELVALEAVTAERDWYASQQSHEA